MALFTCGHKIPDSDSIIGAIAMAYLQEKLGNEAIAARQGEINPESQYILDKFNLETPIFKDSYAGEDIFLVDYNNYTEAPEDLKEANIVGIADHHKLGGLITSGPLDVWIRAVGCSNTVIKEMFDYYEVEIPKNIAGAMMCAILSDTVIFKSPTCTKVDTKICKELADIAGIEDYKGIGLEMFKVKSQVEGVPMRNLVQRDFKAFDMNGTKVGIGQLEVVDLSIFDNMKNDLIADIASLKEEEGFDTVLLLLTDIMAMGSQILVATNSLDIVEKSWDVKVENDQFWLDGCLSRKKQVVPFLEPSFK
ncbi:MAG: manganese-dependent inorganic pyrophosphatase [Campylobacteraceae bacterium]|jgi:manganese-dependent inorganic pyrophosphatase|nr:manganese-dependent inorganic pyrophosphatase [Campylobacteraceae bacterium]MBT5983104.1 manganese-dependent inorganic pyrophosphatase [Campylobacteraceae bacterium]MBT7273695.1 manganese-dependent inorganic pyrophosphatase [Campylobacteraceae bacterium]